jgi:hypothetical protein
MKASVDDATPVEREGYGGGYQDILSNLQTPCATSFPTARAREIWATTATGADLGAFTGFLRLRIQRYPTAVGAENLHDFANLFTLVWIENKDEFGGISTLSK